MLLFLCVTCTSAVAILSRHWLVFACFQLLLSAYVYADRAREACAWHRSSKADGYDACVVCKVCVDGRAGYQAHACHDWRLLLCPPRFEDCQFASFVKFGSNGILQRTEKPTGIYESLYLYYVYTYHIYIYIHIYIYSQILKL